MMCFFLAISFGLGTTLFLYVGEICSDEAMSIVSSLFWILNIAAAVLSPYMVNEWLPDGRTWLFFAICSVIGLIFYIFVMVETKGKTVEELRTSYHS